jgi:hypothetical protein
LLFRADSLRYSELEFWLNDGTYGKRNSLGREIVNYSSLEMENKAYVEISYAPRKTDAEWKVIGPDRLVVQVAYPLRGNIHRLQLNHKTDQGLKVEILNGRSEKISVREDGSEELITGGYLRTYVITGLNGKAAFDLSLMASYTPEAFGEPLYAKYSFTREDVPWYY